MARNGKTNMNPAGSSHGEQLQPKRLTLMKTLIEKMMMMRLMARRERQVMTRGNCHASNIFLSGISLFYRYRESDGKGNLPN